YFNTCMHGLEELLRYADRNSMAHGREVRLPFLNHELVEFIFSLPANDKIRELIIDAKKILVDEKILKPEVINKRIEAKPAHEAANYDWRYLTSSFLFK